MSSRKLRSFNVKPVLLASSVSCYCLVDCQIQNALPRMKWRLITMNYSWIRPPPAPKEVTLDVRLAPPYIRPMSKSVTHRYFNQNVTRHTTWTGECNRLEAKPPAKRSRVRIQQNASRRSTFPSSLSLGSHQIPIEFRGRNWNDAIHSTVHNFCGW